MSLTSSPSERIMACPRFARLVAARSRFAWTLTAVVLGIYYGYMMVVSFAPQLLAAPLSDGGTLPVGVPVGAAIIVLSWVLTGVYIRRANSEFDALTEQVLEEHAP